MGRHHKPGHVKTNARRLAIGGALATAAAVGTTGAASADPAVVTVSTPAPAVDWTPIIRCESGGSPTVDRLAVDGASTASGLYQFVDGTWAAYGGLQFAPRAKDATPAEQTIVAERAFAANGLTDWASSKGCWGGKVNTSAPARVPAAATPRVTPKPATSSGRHASGQQAPVRARTAAPRHAAPAPADQAGRYTVRAGDTLSEIAYAHGHRDWHDLWQRNRGVVGDNPHLIFPGQVLVLS